MKAECIQGISTGNHFKDACGIMEIKGECVTRLEKRQSQERADT